MQLLVVLLHREDLLDEVLSVLVEFELSDPVVIDSRSGLELLERDLPIFAGLRSLIPGGIDFSRLVLSLVEDDDAGAQAMAAVCRLGDQVPHIAGEAASTVMLLPVTAARHF